LKISFISGVFNVLHLGHLSLFNYAKSISDKLIIGLIENPEEGFENLNSLKYRKQLLNECEYVDKVVIIKGDILDTLNDVKPNLIIKGKEFQNKNNIEQAYTKKNNTSIIFSSGVGSMPIKFDKVVDHNIQLDKDFLFRNKINSKSLKKTINNFKNLNVCVLGETIIDEYIYHETMGVSQEDFISVLRPRHSNKFLGGAAIVASNCAKLGSKTHFISIGGNTDKEKFVMEQLEDLNIKAKLFLDDNTHIVHKQRFKNEENTVFRVNHYSHDEISISTQNQIIKYFKRNYDKFDAVIISDFNYGCIPKNLYQNILELCKNKKIKLYTDSQLSSQIGDITRFVNSDISFQTEYEIRTTLKNTHDSLNEISYQFFKQVNSKNVLLKLNSNGILINSFFSSNSSYTDTIRAFNKNPTHTSGAGDSLLCVAALAYTLTEDIALSSFLGSLSAALQVSKKDSILISKENLFEYLV
jgi:rfaE bifunctional protein kinase chain/domain